MVAETATQVVKGRVLVPEDRKVIEQGVVVLAGREVACAGPLDACRWPEGTPVHNAEHATILPGLIDLHVHARPHYVEAFLPAGVTTVRDTNNTLATVSALREHPGAPRVLASGPLVDGPRSALAGFEGADPGHPALDAPSDLMPVVVEGPEEAETAVAALAGQGVDLVKAYEQLEPAALRALVDAAHDEGLPVAADLGMVFTRGLDGAQVDIVEAAEAGVSTLEHLSGLALAYQRRGGEPLAAEVNEEIVREIARQLTRTGAAFVPTVANVMQFEDPEALGLEGLPGVATMEPLMQPQWHGAMAGAEANRAAVEADRRLTEALLMELVDAGALIGAGSDLPAAPGVYPGWGLHQELEALVRLGMGAEEALYAATLGAARILAREDLGRLAPGASADLVVVRGDPTRDIRDTRQVEAVWFRGEPVELDEAWSSLEDSMRAAMEEMEE